MNKDYMPKARYRLWIYIAAALVSVSSIAAEALFPAYFGSAEETAARLLAIFALALAALKVTPDPKDES